MPKEKRNMHNELEPVCDSTSLNYYKEKLIGFLCNGQHKEASIWLGDLAENTPELVRTFFSIILITKNRGDRIRNTIRALKRISYPPSRYEIIIVDNGSTDNTREIVYEELADSSCETKYVVQPAGSLCAARNAGINVALGNWVGFIDDDAVCNPDWILFYLSGLLTIPEAVGMGGPIDLPPEYQKPAWWRPRHSGLLSCKRTTEEISRSKILDFPYGTNMWLNRAIFEETGKFDEKLDVLCKGIADEADLFIRIQKKGCTVILVPDARVTHCVHINRLKFMNIIRRAFQVGRSQLILDRLHSPFIKIGVPLWKHLQRSLNHEMMGPIYVALPIELSLWLGYMAEKMIIIKHKNL